MEEPATFQERMVSSVGGVCRMRRFRWNHFPGRMGALTLGKPYPLALPDFVLVESAGVVVPGRLKILEVCARLAAIARLGQHSKNWRRIRWLGSHDGIIKTGTRARGSLQACVGRSLWGRMISAEGAQDALIYLLISDHSTILAYGPVQVVSRFGGLVKHFTSLHSLSCVTAGPL